MRRIDTSNTLFTEGNPSTGVPATPVRDWWLNHIQEEIALAIEGFGGTLDANNKHQLKDLLLARFAAIPGAPDLSGYVVKNAGVMLADPTVALGVATKQYVDAAAAGEVSVANDEISVLVLSSYPTSYTAWDISSLVPAGNRFAIVTLTMTHKSTLGTAGSMAEIWTRPQGSSATGMMTLCSRGAQGGDAATGSSGQWILPIGANRKLDYKFVNAPAVNADTVVTFRLQGYMK